MSLSACGAFSGASSSSAGSASPARLTGSASFAADALTWSRLNAVACPDSKEAKPIALPRTAAAVRFAPAP